MNQKERNALALIDSIYWSLRAKVKQQREDTLAFELPEGCCPPSPDTQILEGYEQAQKLAEEVGWEYAIIDPLSLDPTWRIYKKDSEGEQVAIIGEKPFNESHSWTITFQEALEFEQKQNFWGKTSEEQAESLIQIGHTWGMVKNSMSGIRQHARDIFIRAKMLSKDEHNIRICKEMIRSLSL